MSETKTRKPRLSWRCVSHYDPVRFRLKLGEREIAQIYFTKNDGFNPLPREKQGYYWAARSDELGIPFANTSSNPLYATPEEAKTAATQYVKDYLIPQ